MTLKAKVWLPSASSGEVEHAIARVAQDWQARWLVDPAPLRARKTASTSLRASTRVVAKDDALVGLGLAICAHTGDPQNGRDRELLEAVAREAISDLQDFLANTEVNEAGSEEAQAFELGPESGDWSITLSLMPQDIIAIRKQAAGESRIVDEGSLGEAISGEAVRLGCHLGNASLTAAEVAALGPGDLIVLSGKLAQDLPVTVEGIVCAGGMARVTQLESAIGIRLAGPINLEAKVETENG